MADIDVKNLAHLARIEVSDEELKELEKEIPEILAFVDDIQKAGGEVKKIAGKHRNIMREDVDPHESGVFTKDILDAAPDTQDGKIRVSQVIKN